MKFILPPMSVRDAATLVLNCCMHTMANKLPWDDARTYLQSFMEDMYELGMQKGIAMSQQKNTPLPELEVVEAIKEYNDDK